jgi:hypothetical protein
MERGSRLPVESSRLLQVRRIGERQCPEVDVCFQT